MADRIKSFEEFWPYYLSEHRDARSRRLHFMGTSGFFTLTLTDSTSKPPSIWPAMVSARLSSRFWPGPSMVSLTRRYMRE